MKVKGATFLPKRRRSSPDVCGCSFDVSASRSVGTLHGNGNSNAKWVGIKDSPPLLEVFFSPAMHFAPHTPVVLCVVVACGVAICCAMHYSHVLLCCYFCDCALFVV